MIRLIYMFVPSHGFTNISGIMGRNRWPGLKKRGGGSELGVKASALKRTADPEWANKEKERARQAARLSHSKHAGTKEYSERQRKKSLRANPLKGAG